MITRVEIWMGAVWLALAGAFLVSMYLLAPLAMIPILDVMVLPALILPTLFVYATAFLLPYLLLVAAFRGRLSVPGRIVIASACAVLVGAAAFAIPAAANQRTEARAASLDRAERPAPVSLPAVGSVALVRLSNAYAPILDCDDFCLALLLSGRAAEVIVAGEKTGAVSPSPAAVGRAYRLARTAEECRPDDPSWREHFAGEPLETALGTGGFHDAFAPARADCLVSRPASPLQADFLFASVLPDRGAETWFRIDWALSPLNIVSVDRVTDMRAGRRSVRMLRIGRFAYRLDRPLSLFPVSGNAASGAGPGHWSRTEIERPSLDGLAGWWGMVANAEEIYRAATGGAHP